MVRASVSLVSSAGGVSGTTRSDLDATESKLDYSLLGPPGFAVAPLSVSDQASFTVTKRA